ncbi:MAG: dienelactone hydrolase family protein [Flavobacteriales bacterium]
MPGTGRSVLLLAAFGASSICAYAQECCAQASTTPFATLAANEVFRNTHMEPRAYQGGTIAGEWVLIPMADGSQTKAWLVPARSASARWLFVFHEWWGLNDFIRAEGARLAGELDSTTVLCLDMYSGKTSTDRNGAAALMGGMTKEHARAVVAAAIAYVGPEARVATIGWCMGGGLSLQASMALAQQGVGCVLYYGMPEEDPVKLAALNAPVLGIFAEEDATINADVVNRFAKNMAKANRQLTVETYKADHAFANPSNPHHDVKATRDANAKTLAFLKRVLTPSDR